MGREATFFDLDRTLLRGTSNRTISAALKEVGVIDRDGLPGSALLGRLHETVGETRVTMTLARLSIRLSSGWSISEVRRAARVAAVQLVAALQPHAPDLLDHHRSRGRVLVLATTTPAVFIEPFAALLGFDDLVATRLDHTNGNLNGRLDGPFAWNTGKLRAVREYAAQEHLDLARSWAYSDSYFDRPLLGAVGHPVVVNPDPRLRALAAWRKWPTLRLDRPLHLEPPGTA